MFTNPQFIETIVRVSYNNVAIFQGTRTDAILFLFDNGYVQEERVHPQLRRKYGSQRSRRAASYIPGITFQELNSD